MISEGDKNNRYVVEILTNYRRRQQNKMISKWYQCDIIKSCQLRDKIQLTTCELEKS